jgi:HD-like signal output (HDOD) protein
VTALRRILFVDDDKALLDGMRKTLRSRRTSWDMVFALGGRAALAELDGATFDVVVSDMRMPEVDGVGVLGRVRERDPSTVRMLLSGYADRTAVLRVLPLAHQLFSKPVDIRHVAQAIDRACDLRALFGDQKLRAVVGQIDRLPAAPHLYHELSGLCGSPDAHVHQIAAVIERDPAMATRVMQLASSSFFASDAPVDTIGAAVARVGLEMISGLALASYALLAFGTVARGFALDAFQQHALDVALRARAAVTDRSLAGPAYTAGLVHDIGKLVIAALLPTRHAEIQREQAESRSSTALAERAVLGTTHAELGAYLLGLWGLPMAIIEAVAAHNNPIAPASPLLAALREAHTCV